MKKSNMKFKPSNWSTSMNKTNKSQVEQLNYHVRSLKVYNAFKKNTLRKRRYTVPQVILSFWGQLTAKFISNNMLPLAATKLWALNIAQVSDKNRYSNFDVTVVNIMKHKKFVLQIKGCTGYNVTSISIYYDPFLAHNKLYQPWFTKVYDSTLNKYILLLVDPVSGKLHCINTDIVNTVNIYVGDTNKNKPVGLTTRALFKQVQKTKIKLIKLSSTNALLKRTLSNTCLTLRTSEHLAKLKAHNQLIVQRNKLKRKVILFKRLKKKLKSHFTQRSIMSMRNRIKLADLALNVDTNTLPIIKKRVKKFSPIWYKLEAAKFLRFKAKYDGRDLPKLAQWKMMKPWLRRSFGKFLKKFYKDELLLVRDNDKALLAQKASLKAFVAEFTTDEQKYNKIKRSKAKRAKRKFRKLHYLSTKIIKTWDNSASLNKFKPQLSKLVIGIDFLNLNKTHFICVANIDSFINTRFKFLRGSVSSKFKNLIINEFIFAKQIPVLIPAKQAAKKKFVGSIKEHRALRILSVKLNHSQLLVLLNKWRRSSDNTARLSRVELLQRAWLSKLRITKKARRNRTTQMYRSVNKILNSKTKQLNHKYVVKTKVLLASLSLRSVANKYILKNEKAKAVLAKVRNQINYKLKWFNYYEFKSFRWKFYKKRWYFAMSRWKRLAEFRRMLRNAWRNYRKLKKNFLFIKLLRANFNYILGLSETDMLNKWVKIRRGDNTNNAISTVERFSQSLQLKMDSLTMFLGLAPNRLMAQEFVHFGGMRVNGMVVTNINHAFNHNDMLQVDMKVNRDIQSLYKPAHWNTVRARVKFAQFFQAQWAIMLFMMVRWPHNYELLEESIMDQRWVRFFIRYFPIRISKYQKAKVKWYKY